MCAVAGELRPVKEPGVAVWVHLGAYVEKPSNLPNGVAGAGIEDQELLWGNGGDYMLLVQLSVPDVPKVRLPGTVHHHVGQAEDLGELGEPVEVQARGPSQQVKGTKQRAKAECSRDVGEKEEQWIPSPVVEPALSHVVLVARKPRLPFPRCEDHFGLRIGPPQVVKHRGDNRIEQSPFLWDVLKDLVQVGNFDPADIEM
mmetsp:Transcript_50645/g.120865  ORF Transcript_50645/g.120865 Transcript_50645/m.120865 type:complete len:200 (-) Transcript_50645:336-935(-)